MRRARGGRSARAALALLAALAVAAGCGGGSPEGVGPLTVVQDDAELLYRSDAQMAGVLDDLRAAGVDWVRVTAGWSVIAPAPEAAQRPAGFDATDPEAYTPGAWDRLDRLARMARERGIELNIDIAFWAPRWAVAQAGDAADRERIAPDPRHFADFAQAVARRFPDAGAFTVWNEPNHNVFLLPQWEKGPGGDLEPVSPHVYRAMLHAAVPRLREAAPDATVLIGATSSLGASEPQEADDRMSPMVFLRALACVDEALEPVRDGRCVGFRPLPGDGWSHHPYGGRQPPWEPSAQDKDVRMADLGRLTSTLDRLHESGRIERRLDLYLTEFGYQTNPPDPTWDITPDDAARWLSEAERIARANPRVRSTTHFLVRDLPEREGDSLRERWRDYQTGLYFIDGSPKPTRAAFAAPLVALSEQPGRVALWGFVRPGEGERRWRILTRPAGGGAWRELAAGVTPADGRLQATVPADPEATFLLEADVDGRTVAGAPVNGAR
ncbi:MAG: cellulase family glycosylhydrolase [Solirubrobacterales bacterium]|nr:cellulase family glycosylhydrolase [Solirubrobacterales bacterium]